MPERLRDEPAARPEDGRDGRPRYRVVQWATGNIGTRAMRAVLEHPTLTLAGAYVHSPDKAGKDAGELCGLGPAGVAATGDVGEILALQPDCVLYMPRACDFDTVCLLLEAGVNIVTTRGEFHRPDSMDPDVRKRVEAACRRGGASIHSTGSSPGFITEAVPLVLTSIQRRLDRLTISEFADLSERDSPGLLFDVMGFGRAPADMDARRLSHGRVSFGPSLELLADTLGLPLDRLEASGEVATAPRTVRIAAGEIPAGTVAGQRITVSGIRDGRPLLRFRATWYCTTDLDADWDVRDTGWHIAVEGDTPLDVDLRFPVPLDRMAATTPGYTAHRAVNAVPIVCAAEPGIRTTADLPQIVAALG
ncbi:NAD(P)H-dependent amine dehydrogenase family protein [Actinomadura algeriensis]|uniref:4-hydroxy-tetrahydrodipicolinate reductase n=1 Tax=Actinomadura algeriensis TaxID=1679523 RepID=A0ABR9JZF3_9ACTN|nr:dihydrodipicolinate reductase [Actinomadura algeriensis]MBE1535485.1 4-hydroxy-tetrahydrodipicolinate reductase [Actinomadura algeriensis]